MWMFRWFSVLMLALLVMVVLTGCPAKPKPPDTNVKVVGDGNITNVGTGGGAAGSGDCGPNVNSTASRNPTGNPSSPAANTPNCSDNSVQNPPLVLTQTVQGMKSLTGLDVRDIR